MQVITAVSLGIVLGSLSSPALGSSLCGVCFAIAGVSRTIRRGPHRAGLIALFLVAASVSCARYTLVENNLERASLRTLTAESFTGYVVADAEPRGVRSVSIVATRIADQNVRLRVSHPRYPVIAPGTVVDVSGDVKLAESFETEGGGVFDYRSFLRARSVVSIVENATLVETYVQPFSSDLHLNLKLSAYVVHVTSKLEATLVESVNSILGRREGALILGMTLGRKDDLDESDQDDFKTSGLMHIVVLSGSNVAIVVAAMTTLTSRMVPGTGPLARATRVIAPMSGAWMLVIASGADPSARRAGLMSSVSLISNSLPSSVEILNATRSTSKSSVEIVIEFIAGKNGYRQLATLTATAGFMAFVNPHAPRFDTSYGLSFLAAFGVTFIAPVFARILRMVPERFGVRETLSQCLAAQVATYPIISQMGSSQSWMALVANITAAPLVPLAMGSGAAVGLLNLFSSEVALPAAFIATATTRAIYAIAFFAAVS